MPDCKEGKKSGRHSDQPEQAAGLRRGVLNNPAHVQYIYGITGYRGAAGNPVIRVVVHGYYDTFCERHLLEQARPLSREQIAEDWYERVFAPAVAPSVREHVVETFRDAPDADFFLLMYRRRREAFPSGGCPPLEEIAAAL